MRGRKHLLSNQRENTTRQTAAREFLLRLPLCTGLHVPLVLSLSACTGVYTGRRAMHADTSLLMHEGKSACMQMWISTTGDREGEGETDRSHLARIVHPLDFLSLSLAVSGTRRKALPLSGVFLLVFCLLPSPSLSRVRFLCGSFFLGCCLTLKCVVFGMRRHLMPNACRHSMKCRSKALLPQ